MIKGTGSSSAPTPLVIQITWDAEIQHDSHRRREGLDLALLTPVTR